MQTHHGPFRVRSEKGNKRSATNHYDVMSIQDIKDMPVQDIADENCTLFIWVTMPNLIEGIDTIKSWGFTYKTCAFNWVKRNKREQSGSGVWDIGHEVIVSYVYLQQKVVPKSICKCTSSGR